MERLAKGPIFILWDFIRDPSPERSKEVIMAFFTLFVIWLVLAPFHECAHAFAAKLLGDDTAKREGRLTLNPLAHIDPIGFICSLIMYFGWAKPVPINPLNASRKVTMRGFISLTAAAGPASNVIFALITLIIAKIVATSSGPVYIYDAFMMITWMSVFLGVFNLIPIPPLDGSKILFFFLKNHQISFIERNMNIIRPIFLIILFVTPIFSIFIGFFSGIIMAGLNAITFFI